MINKQKLWFLTLFSLILVLSVYYITMPSDVLTTASAINDVKEEQQVSVDVKEEGDILMVLELEKDEERSLLAAEYNTVLTNKESTTEEKNNAYEGLKKIDEIKSKEGSITKKIKDDLKLNSFVKIEKDSVNITLKHKEHDYSLANDVMRLVQEEFDNKMYVSVKFEK